MFRLGLHNWILAHISDTLSWTVQLDTSTYFRCFIVDSTNRYWHMILMIHRVQINKMLAHISEASSCTVQLDTGKYVWFFIMYKTTSYCSLLQMLHRTLYNEILTHISDPSLWIVQHILAHNSYASSWTVHLDTSIYLWCFIMFSTTRYWDIFLMCHQLMYN